MCQNCGVTVSFLPAFSLPYTHYSLIAQRGSAPALCRGPFLGRRRTAAQGLERGVKVGDIRHKTPIGAGDGSFALGIDPARGDYASFADFSDPDGNGWVL